MYESNFKIWLHWFGARSELVSRKPLHALDAFVTRSTMQYEPPDFVSLTNDADIRTGFLAKIGTAGARYHGLLSFSDEAMRNAPLLMTPAQRKNVIVVAKDALATYDSDNYSVKLANQRLFEIGTYALPFTDWRVGDYAGGSAQFLEALRIQNDNEGIQEIMRACEWVGPDLYYPSDVYPYWRGTQFVLDTLCEEIVRAARGKPVYAFFHHLNLATGAELPSSILRMFYPTFRRWGFRGMIWWADINTVPEQTAVQNTITRVCYDAATGAKSEGLWL